MLLGAKSSVNPLELVPIELSLIKRCIEGQSKFEVEYEPYLTSDGLTDLLRKCLDHVGIIHFSGHSNDNSLTSNDSKLSSDSIANYLGTWGSKPSLVFLNGCRNSGQVKAFHDAGIPCVIATRKPILDDLASDFAVEFYRELVAWPEKTTIEQAFERASYLVFKSRKGNYRSIAIEEMTEESTAWDWGLYFSQSVNAKAKADEFRSALTLSNILGNSEFKQSPSTLLAKPDFINQSKYDRLDSRSRRLTEIIAGIEEDLDIAIDSEQRYRLRSRLDTRNNELSEVYAEIEELRAG